MSSIGSWSFIVGLVVAVLVGLYAEASGLMVTILVILGLIVGFLNVAEKEVHGFLMASVALLLAGSAGSLLSSIPAIGSILGNILNNFVVFVAPAAIVVAIKELYNLAKN